MSRLRKGRTLALGSALLMVITGGAVVIANSASAASVTASCVKTSDWTTGFEGKCTVTNGTGASISSWKVEFDLNPGSISSHWDANRVSSGTHHTFTNLSWNGTVAAGASVSFGFVGSGSGALANCKVNGSSCSGGGTPGDTQAPTAPTNLSSTGKTATSVSLAWTAATDNVGVTGYDVYRGTTLATSVTGTTATVSGLTASTAYTFTVRAKDAAGNTSGASNALSVTTDGSGGGDTQAPSVPGSLRSTAKTSSSVALAWNASTDNVGVAGYDVYRGSTLELSVSGTTANVTSLAANTAYTFTVRAKDAAGNTSGASNAVTVTTDQATNPGPAGAMKLGYFAQWGVYGRGYHVKNIDTSGSAAKLTHINYAFGNVQGGACTIGDSYADYDRAYTAAESVDGVADTWDQPVRGSFNQLRKLKAKYPNIKVIWSFGGWTWSGGFGAAAANPTAFANSCYNLVEDPRWADVFDGIDIDWEYPNACGLSCDTSGFSSYKNLMGALRSRFGTGNLVTSAITADGTSGGKIDAADYAGAAQYVDYYLPMTYDFFGAWAAQGPTAPHSPLTSYAGIPQAGFYSDNAIQKLKSKGIPANKMALGIGFYGRGWTGVTQTTPGGSATGAAPGTYEAGIEDYKVLKNSCPATGTIAGTAYAKCGSNWWSYDTPATIASKMAYAKNQGLAGAFFWEFSGDTPNGELMTAIKNGIG
jgi:chitinase